MGTFCALGTRSVPRAAALSVYCQRGPILTENGQRAATSLTPAPLGNRRAQRNGAYVSRFTAAELDEIRELEDEIRQLTPVSSPSVKSSLGRPGSRSRRPRSRRPRSRH